MRWLIGSCVLALAAVLAGRALAYADDDGWSPFKLHMTLSQLRAVRGFEWSETHRFQSSPGHEWVTYQAKKPVRVEGRPFELSVSFIDDEIIDITLRRRLNLPEAACRAQYEALLTKLEARYGPSAQAEAYSYKSNTVIDVPEGEDAVVEHHAGLESTSTLYRSYEVPKLLRTHFDSLNEEMRLASLGGEIRCTDLALVVH
ncbi:MAG TPA: hypothetical protein VGM25_15510 [Caulobacteraceae bacterium]|jgi:hypothetical protein